jgi:hypothetical protein
MVCAWSPFKQSNAINRVVSLDNINKGLIGHENLRDKTKENYKRTPQGEIGDMIGYINITQKSEARDYV